MSNPSGLARTKRVGKWICLTAAGLFVVGAILNALFGLSFIFGTRSSMRFDMMEEDVKSRCWVGGSRQAMREWYGPPDFNQQFEGWDFVYPLGNKGLTFSSKQDWMVVRFDGDTVADVAIVRR